MSKVYVKMFTVLKIFVNYNVCIFLVICAMCVDFAKQLITNNFASTHAKLVTFGIMGIYLCSIRTGCGSVCCCFFFRSHATWFKGALSRF